MPEKMDVDPLKEKAREMDLEERMCDKPKVKGKLRLQKCPKTEAVEFSDADACLKKLLEDNPYLYNGLKRMPITDALKKFNEERLKTTYQVDYEHVDGIKLKGREAGQKKDEEKKSPCPLDNKLVEEEEDPEKQCKTKSRKELMRRRGIRVSRPPADFCLDKIKVMHKKSEVPNFLLKTLPPWSTEYRDVINKNAHAIMREVRMTSKAKAKVKKRKMLQLAGCDMDKFVI